MELSDSTTRTETTRCCPLCGSNEFDIEAPAAGDGFVTRTCAACGLICRVVIGPESPSLSTLGQEWAAAFAHD